MARSRHTALSVLVCAVLTTGCGVASDPSDPTAGTAGPDAATSSPPPAAGVPGHREARSLDVEATPFILAVTNQSFTDPDAGLVITVDGVLMVDESFPVEGQHTQTFFGLDLPPGEHTVVITSDTGATATETVELPAGETR